MMNVEGYYVVQLKIILIIGIEFKKMVDKLNLICDEIC